jgi:hypothetical protein
LGREYAEATSRHVELLKDQERGVGNREQEIASAGLRRESLQMWIRIHLAVDHSNEPSLALAVPR